MADKNLEAADYLRFIDKKGMQPICPLCRSDRWSFIAESDSQSYGLLKTDRHKPDIGGLQTANILLLTCQNCGFIAPILRQKIVSELGKGNG